MSNLYLSQTVLCSSFLIVENKSVIPFENSVQARESIMQVLIALYLLAFATVSGLLKENEEKNLHTG